MFRSIYVLIEISNFEHRASLGLIDAESVVLDRGLAFPLDFFVHVLL